MKRTIICLFALLMVEGVLGDEHSEFDRTMQEVASDLSAVHDELQAAYAAESVRNLVAEAMLNFTMAKENQGFIEITKPAHLYKGADVSAEFFQSVAEGMQFQYVDKVSDWYAVALEEPIEGFSTGWVQAAQAVPVWDPVKIEMIYAAGQSNRPKGVSDALYKRIVESVSSVREKYEENRHIAITGFSVDIGVPPAVSIQFEFKGSSR